MKEDVFPEIRGITIRVLVASLLLSIASIAMIADTYRAMESHTLGFHGLAFPGLAHQTGLYIYTSIFLIAVIVATRKGIIAAKWAFAASNRNKVAYDENAKNKALFLEKEIEIKYTQQELGKNTVALKRAKNENILLKRFPTFFGHDAKKVIEHTIDDAEKFIDEKIDEKKINDLIDSLKYIRAIMTAIPTGEKTIATAVLENNFGNHKKIAKYDLSNWVLKSVEKLVLDIDYIDSKKSEQAFFDDLTTTTGEHTTLESPHVFAKISTPIAHIGNEYYLYYTLNLLLDNARIHGRISDQRICITTYETTSHIVIDIYNPARIPSFEPLMLGSSSQGEGRGTGLYIADEISIGMDGKLRYRPVKPELQRLEIASDDSCILFHLGLSNRRKNRILIRSGKEIENRTYEWQSTSTEKLQISFSGKTTIYDTGPKSPYLNTHSKCIEIFDPARYENGLCEWMLEFNPKSHKIKLTVFDITGVEFSIHLNKSPFNLPV